MKRACQTPRATSSPVVPRDRLSGLPTALVDLLCSLLSLRDWARFRAATRARIGLGRAGDAVPTREALAHLQAITGRITGADIMEFNPTQDTTQITATVAAKLLKETLGKMILS